VKSVFATPGLGRFNNRKIFTNAVNNVDRFFRKILQKFCELAAKTMDLSIDSEDSSTTKRCQEKPLCIGL
jgi:hypothetical protein